MEFTVSREFLDFMISIKNRSTQDQIMYLSIFVDSTDEELKKLYIESAQKHNTKILEDPQFYEKFSKEKQVEFFKNKTQIEQKIELIYQSLDELLKKI